MPRPLNPNSDTWPTGNESYLIDHRSSSLLVINRRHPAFQRPVGTHRCADRTAHWAMAIIFCSDENRSSGERIFKNSFSENALYYAHIRAFPDPT